MTFEETIIKIEEDFSSVSDKNKIDLIYAFNGTGKTRISRYLLELKENKCLCFNSLFQDSFVWDNDSYILKIASNSWIVNMINEQGLQNEIIKNFQNIYNNEIEPQISSDNSQISFNIKTIEGYDNNIKISKAEETIFIWSVFYTILEVAISELSEEKDDRTTCIFDELDLIIIDDPVSSIDDSKIMTIAISLFNLIEICIIKSVKIDFLITTHHALFYNGFYNLIHRDSKIKDKSYILTKKDYMYILTTKGDTAFGYHLVLKNKILEAIRLNSIEKNHFNMFRILLEKTSNYFGYKKFDDCLFEADYKQEIVKLINIYSHGNLPEFEYSELTENEKDIFVKAFKDFINYYKMEAEDYE